ncbi:sulfotransferase family protein [Thalassotalea euphylliae]|uniref:sulfotransferase family protein n=1 Tax=Thalassotalea euphylliae TaxID=1655234 RepID=UPI003631A229
MLLSKAIHNITKNRFVVPYTPFYRHYPFQGRPSIKSADDRGCVDFELGIFYNRVPKAANSTIVSNLVNTKLGHEIDSPQAKKIFRSPSTLSKYELEQFEGLFKFTVVRDPFSRTLSAFLDKIDRKYNQHHQKVSFKDFLKTLKEGKLHSNLHWAPQSSIFLIPFEKFQFVGRFENLNADLSTIIRHIDNQSAALHSFSRKGPPSTSANEKLRKFYDEECEELVKQMYKQDFALLEYNDSIQ